MQRDDTHDTIRELTQDLGDSVIDVCRMHKYANGTCQWRRCRCQKACRTRQSALHWLAAYGFRG